ncbi:MAG: aromatic amino acid lyase, partial [Kiloniellaceae bacterium]
MSHAATPIILTGQDLNLESLAAIARDGRAVAIDHGARARMARGRAIVERHLADQRPVYGLTTGLGSRAVERLPRDALAEFSRLTVRGRSHALGQPLARESVRAIMAARLNGLLQGGAGADPAVADALAASLNAGLSPVVPSIGSVGAGDLCLLAHIGLALIGEGEIEADGAVLPAAQALARAGLAPLVLGPKDGLAICNASAASAGVGALALHDAGEIWRLANLAAALSLEGFRGNPGPLDARLAALRPQPGQAESAADIRAHLAGGALREPGAARRLQDPLSLRCVAPVHGALWAALAFAEPALSAELNGDASNPAVLLDDDEILSTGNFHTPLLTVAFDAVAQACAQVAQLALARTAKLLVARLSDLPANLSRPGPARSGFAPALQPVEALV